MPPFLVGHATTQPPPPSLPSSLSSITPPISITDTSKPINAASHPPLPRFHHGRPTPMPWPPPPILLPRSKPPASAPSLPSLVLAAAKPAPVIDPPPRQAPASTFTTASRCSSTPLNAGHHLRFSIASLLHVTAASRSQSSSSIAATTFDPPWVPPPRSHDLPAILSMADHRLSHLLPLGLEPTPPSPPQALCIIFTMLPTPPLPSLSAMPNYN